MKKLGFLTNLDEWNQVAPEGATHYDPEFDGIPEAWVRVDDRGNHYFCRNNGWINASVTGDEMGDVNKMIKKPGQTNFEPVVGETIQFRLKGVHDDFIMAEVLGNDGDGEIWLKYLDYPNHKASYPINSLDISFGSLDKQRWLASVQKVVGIVKTEEMRGVLEEIWDAGLGKLKEQ